MHEEDQIIIIIKPSCLGSVTSYRLQILTSPKVEHASFDNLFQIRGNAYMQYFCIGQQPLSAAIIVVSGRCSKPCGSTELGCSLSTYARCDMCDCLSCCYDCAYMHISFAGQVQVVGTWSSMMRMLTDAIEQPCRHCLFWCVMDAICFTNDQSVPTPSPMQAPCNCDGKIVCSGPAPCFHAI